LIIKHNNKIDSLNLSMSVGIAVFWFKLISKSIK
jgi:tRNA G18 (ribose-2'-O)-methylase SpoU